MSSVDKHLASYPYTAAGSRALASHLRDDHGKAEDHSAHSAMHAAAHQADQRRSLPARDAVGRPHSPHNPAPADTEPAEDSNGSPGTVGHDHTWACASPQHGPDATYRCGCGETALGSEIGVTRQARDWFYAPAARQHVHVTTRHQWPGYRRHNSATAQALARHLRGEGFQSLDIDPGDQGAADLLAAWDATEGQTFGPTQAREW